MESFNWANAVTPADRVTIQDALDAAGFSNFLIGHQEIDDGITDYWCHKVFLDQNDRKCALEDPVENGCVPLLATINTALGTSYADIDAWIAATWTGGDESSSYQAEVQAADETNGIGLSTGTSIYGSQFALFENDPVNVTTSISGVDAFNVTYNAGVSGKYRIKVSYNWSLDSTSSDFLSYLRVDNASITQHSQGMIHREEPKDSSGSSWEGTGTDQSHAYTRYFYTDFTAGDHDVRLKFCPSSNNVEAGMWDANIEIIRVS